MVIETERLYLRETDEMIGDCGLTMQLIGGEIKPEIGYHIRSDKQRKGYLNISLLLTNGITCDKL